MQSAAQRPDFRDHSRGTRAGTKINGHASCPAKVASRGRDLESNRSDLRCHDPLRRGSRDLRHGDCETEGDGETTIFPVCRIATPVAGSLRPARLTGRSPDFTPRSP